MVGFDDGSLTDRVIDDHSVQTINANLTAGIDITKAIRLRANLNRCFIGSKKAGEFEIEEKKAVSWLNLPDPHGRPNSDVLRRFSRLSRIPAKDQPSYMPERQGFELLRLR